MPELIVKPARLGCQGCYYDTHEGCPTDIKQPREIWPCTINGESIIWVEQDDARGEITTSE